ncbi:MAG: VCBS repeat-containing protein [candidate division WOR-3 bacterium]
MRRLVLILMIGVLYSQEMDWRMFQRDNQRTGFTPYKGNFSDTLYSVKDSIYFYSLTPAPPLIGDFESDGNMEIVTKCTYYFQGNYRRGIVVNDAKTGEIKWRFPLPALSDRDGDIPVIEDVNNDGIKEIITSWRPSPWCLRNANGMVFVINTQTHDSLWVYKNDTLMFTSTAAGDVDGDGINEIVFSAVKYGADTIPSLFILNGEDGSIYNIVDSFFVGNFSLYKKVPCSAYPVLCDLNNDGVYDILGVRYYSNTVFKLCAYDAKNKLFLWEKNFPAWRIAAADLDNNGINEVITLTQRTLDSPETIYIRCLNGFNGDIIWEKAMNSKERFPFPFAIGNINSDMEKEIVFAQGDWQVTGGAVYTFNKDGQILWGKDPIDLFAVLDIDHVGEYHIAPHIVDINNDGEMEILIEFAYACMIYSFNGNNGEYFLYKIPYVLPDTFPGGYVPLITFGDADNDGYLEIIATVSDVLGWHKTQLFILDETLEIKERIVLPERRKEKGFIYSVSGQRFLKEKIKKLPSGIYFSPFENKKYIILRREK